MNDVPLLKHFTEDELEQRRSSLGGSDAPVIVHGKFFGKTTVDLWKEKTGRVKPEDLTNKLQVQMGTYTEDLNRYWCSKQMDIPITTEGCEGLTHPKSAK